MKHPPEGMKFDQDAARAIAKHGAGKRDITMFPYTHDELRVVEYLSRIMPDLGMGDDPIGFLIASHTSQTVWVGARLDEDKKEGRVM